MPKKPGVLIVDRSGESRRCFAQRSARLNCNIYETDRAEVAAALNKLHRPDVIVLDLEAHGADDLLPKPIADASTNDPPKWIILGTIRRGTPPGGEFVAINKPYHYQPLISKIEHMLQARRGSQRAGKAA